jgi:hypothetical protein
MRREKIELALMQAAYFLAYAKLVMVAAETTGMPIPKKTEQGLRAASMELSKGLADMRKGR